MDDESMWWRINERINKATYNCHKYLRILLEIVFLILLQPISIASYLRNKPAKKNRSSYLSKGLLVHSNAAVSAKSSVETSLVNAHWEETWNNQWHKNIYYVSRYFDNQCCYYFLFWMCLCMRFTLMRMGSMEMLCFR